MVHELIPNFFCIAYFYKNPYDTAIGVVILSNKFYRCFFVNHINIIILFHWTRVYMSYFQLMLIFAPIATLGEY